MKFHLYYSLPTLFLGALAFGNAQFDSKSLSQPLGKTFHESDIWDTRYETLIVSEKLLTVNCTHSRMSVVINGTSPGPELRFFTNQRVLIKVVNMLPHDNFTMHWHGLSMASTPWSDGTPLISQWPIAPQASFQYEFVLYPEDAGTYFYHSHVGLQISTGSGPLIIEPRAVPQELEQVEALPEQLMYIQDYWYKTDAELSEGLVSDPFVWTNSSNEIFLNGLSNSTSGAAKCATMFPVINVHPNRSYRFRWIHAGSLMYVSATIAQHNMSLIEADGTNLAPHELHGIEFAPGQRLSTIFHSKSVAEVEADGREGLYTIHLSTRWRNPGIQNFAVLRYILSADADSTLANEKYIDMTCNAPSQDLTVPTPLPSVKPGWIDQSLQALVDVPPPENSNNTLITLSVRQTSWANKGSVWQVNGKSYYEANVTAGQAPYLIQLASGAKTLPSIARAETGPEVYDPITKTYVLEAGQVVDILITNKPNIRGTTEIHPWHLHSRKFWILAQGSEDFNSSTLEEGRFPHPYRRDTVNVYPSDPSIVLRSDQTGGWVLIRYQASESDAGVFPAHCHLSPHLVMGMLVIFVVAPSELPTLLQAYAPYAEFNGEMYGNATYSPPESAYFLQRDVSSRGRDHATSS